MHHAVMARTVPDPIGMAQFMDCFLECPLSKELFVLGQAIEILPQAPKRNHGPPPSDVCLPKDEVESRSKYIDVNHPKDPRTRVVLGGQRIKKSRGNMLAPLPVPALGHQRYCPGYPHAITENLLQGRL